MGGAEQLPDDSTLLKLTDDQLRELAARFGVRQKDAPRQLLLSSLQKRREERRAAAEAAGKKLKARRIRPEGARLPKEGDKVLANVPRTVTLPSGDTWSLEKDEEAEVTSVSVNCCRFSLCNSEGVEAEGQWVVKFRHKDGTPCGRYVNEDEDDEEEFEHVAIPSADDGTEEVTYTDTMGNDVCWHLSDGRLIYSEKGQEDAPLFERLTLQFDTLTLTMEPTGWYSPLPRNLLPTILAGLRHLAVVSSPEIGHNFVGDAIRIVRQHVPPPRIHLNTDTVWPELAGVYLVQPGLIRGFPWWMKEVGTGWLSINWDRSNWMFSLELDHFERGIGWIACGQPPNGRLPHKVRLWAFTPSPDDPWIPMEGISVEVAAAAAAPAVSATPDTPTAAPAAPPAPAPLPGHPGEWRGEEKRRWCSMPGREEGKVCVHGIDVIETQHWSCCGCLSETSKRCRSFPFTISAAAAAAILAPLLVEVQQPQRHRQRLVVSAEASARAAIQEVEAMAHPTAMLTSAVTKRAAVAGALVCTWAAGMDVAEGLEAAMIFAGRCAELEAWEA
eukprot:Hpha_TRINITY_DN30521_c0_g1::TRINITY_DN30521_c0_g1_i1::g.193646::m.193646